MKQFAGCFVSVCYFGLLLLILAGSMLGDCVEELGRPCPTDHERNVRLLMILIGGTAMYIIGAVVIVHLLNTRSDENETD